MSSGGVITGTAPTVSEVQLILLMLEQQVEQTLPIELLILL